MTNYNLHTLPLNYSKITQTCYSMNIKIEYLLWKKSM